MARVSARTVAPLGRLDQGFSVLESKAESTPENGTDGVFGPTTRIYR